jgi:hypothetical protein
MIYKSRFHNSVCWPVCCYPVFSASVLGFIAISSPTGSSDSKAACNAACSSWYFLYASSYLAILSLNSFSLWGAVSCSFCNILPNY